MRDNISIAAIIPLYNGAKYIERAIQSVVNQTLAADELIVVDDGSTDNGPHVVERLANSNNIRFVRKSNGGQSSARNFGVANSQSSLVAFLDQDDYWYENHLEELVKPFVAKSTLRIGWTYSTLDEIDENGYLINTDIMKTYNLNFLHPKKSLFQCLSRDMFVLPSASLISKDAFLAVGMFDESLSGYEDDDLFVRLFREGYRNIYIDTPLSAWRMHFSSSSYSTRMAESRMLYFNKLTRQFPDDVARASYWTGDVVAPRFYSIVKHEYKRALRMGRLDEARALADDLSVIFKEINPRRRTWKERVFTQLSANAQLTRHVLRWGGRHP